MRGRAFVQFCIRTALVLCAVGAAPVTAPAQDSAPSGPPNFDFYVLSLSWSPSFCAAAAERNPNRVPGLQCKAHAYGFIVHGLWPQFERGFPEYCEVPAPRLDRAIVSAMLDLMPVPRLVFSEWDRHGTCSGLSPRGYFDTIRRARAKVKIPPQYLDFHETLKVAPADIEGAFITSNPSLAAGDIGIGCDARRLTEVRFCLSKNLEFRACPQIVKRSCRRDLITMPPPHDANAHGSG